MKNIKFICVIASLIIAFATANFGQSATELLQSGRQKIQSPKTLFEGMSEIMKAKAMFVEQGFTDSDAKDYPASIISFTTSLTVKIDFDNAPSSKEFAALRLQYIDAEIAAYQARGASYLFQKKYDEAITDFDRSIENTDVNLIQMYPLRGAAYKEKKEYDKALADYNKAIELFPAVPQNYLNCIEIQIERSNWKAVIATASKLTKVDPKSSAGYQLLGNAYTRNGQFQNAIKNLTIAIRLDPKDADSYLYRGIAYADSPLKNKKALAIADFKKALKLNSNLEGAKEELKKLGVKL
jgi:tetratricopeptide (TPR) repeat protein